MLNICTRMGDELEIVLIFSECDQVELKYSVGSCKWFTFTEEASDDKQREIIKVTQLFEVSTSSADNLHR